MIGVLIWLLPLFVVASFFLFFKRRPKLEPPEQEAVACFNRAVLPVAFVVSLGAAVYFRVTTGESVDRPWWPVLAGLSALALSTVVFFIGFVIRNYIVFRKKGGVPLTSAELVKG